MKIVAQSSVPAKIPHLHIGYTASMSYRPDSSLLIGGVITLIAAFLVLATFGRMSLAKITQKAFGGMTKAIVAISLFALGVGAIALAFVVGDYGYSYPGHFTSFNVMRISRILEEQVAAGQEIPENLPDALITWGLEPEALGDGWQHRISIQKTTKDGVPGILIASAGKDGDFSTGDDIESFVSTEPKPEQK